MDTAEKEKMDEREAKDQAEKEPREETEHEEQEAKKEAIKKKETRKRELEAAKQALQKDPRFQATKWCTGSAKLLTDLQGARTKALKATKFPSGTSETYRKTFDEHMLNLKKHPANLQGEKQQKVA